MSLMMIISGQATPGCRERLFDAFVTHLADRALANNAQPLVVWSADDANADGFHLVEVYTDEESLAMNANAPWFFEYLTETMPLLAAPPTMVQATPLWSKGLIIEARVLDHTRGDPTRKR